MFLGHDFKTVKKPDVIIQHLEFIMLNHLFTILYNILKSVMTSDTGIGYRFNFTNSNTFYQ
jgi:hypothetical protein